MEVVPKLFDLYLPLCELVLEAPILQAQLLDYRGEVKDGWSLSSSIAPWLSWRRLRSHLPGRRTGCCTPLLSIQCPSWGCPLPGHRALFCGIGLVGASWGGAEDHVAMPSLKSCLAIDFHGDGTSLEGLL